MKTSKNGIKFIKGFEGLRVEAYLDSAGVATIGYGHTVGVSIGQKISENKAEEFLESDLKNFEKTINRKIIVDITQNQFDALVSFCFNVGTAAFNQSWVKDFTNQKRFFEVRGQLLRWINAGGKKLKGLERRRIAEADLYENGLIPAHNQYSELLTNELIEVVREEILENSKKWSRLELEQQMLHDRNDKLRKILGSLQ